MSIPSNSVLRRILDEVVAGPQPRDLAASQRAEAPGQLFELFRTPEAYREPYTTSLHFWAHALRAFLEVGGRPDTFAPLAGHCLCDALPKNAIAEGFARLADRFTPPLEVERNSAYHAGFRMIDQDDFVSWVAERPEDPGHEFVAVFWVRPRWLESAQPLPIEPIESFDPNYDPE